MSLKFLLIVALCVIYVNAASHIFHNLNLIFGFEKEMCKTIDIAIKNGDNNRSIINDIITSAMNGSSGCNQNSEKIDNELMVISSQLNYIVTHMRQKLSIVEKEILGLPMQLEIDLVKREITSHITNIRRHYMMAASYSNEAEFYNRDELKSVINTLTDRTSGKDVPSSLTSLYDRIVGPENGNLTSTFLKLYEEHVAMEGDELCGTGLSPNTYLYNLYTIIISAEMMGLVAVSFRYELQYKLHKNSTINNILEAAQKEREERLRNYFTSFKSAIEFLPLDYRSCDPSEHKRYETFFEMEGLYQSILIEEYGKNYADSCSGDCDTINKMHFEDKGIICGRISRCWTIKDPTWCKLTGQLRKYQWIKDAGHTYGVESMCSGVKEHRVSWLFKFGICDSCICVCEGNSLKLAEKYPNSTHIISLLPVSSDISNNMTITGVRLTVRDGIVHIQIKEGQLEAAGQVTSNPTWKDVPDMKTEVYLTRSKNSSIYQEGRDFVVVDEHNDAINLDDVMAPSGCLITGIKWSLAQKNESKSGWQLLEIQIRYTPFNFTSGVLGNSSESEWMSSRTIHDRKMLQLKEFDSPEKSTAKNTPTKALGKALSFSRSSFFKDAGQSTVPFLDGVPVESGLGPLTGIGLFHKAAKGYAGFLSFRMYSLNMGKYMTWTLNSPESQVDYYEYDEHTIDDSEQGDDSLVNKTVLEAVESRSSARRVLSQ